MEVLSAFQIYYDQIFHVAGVPIDKVALLDQETRNYVGKKLLELTLMELFVFHFMQAIYMILPLQIFSLLFLRVSLIPPFSRIWL